MKLLIARLVYRGYQSAIARWCGGMDEGSHSHVYDHDELRHQPVANESFHLAKTTKSVHEKHQMIFRLCLQEAFAFRAAG